LGGLLGGWLVCLILGDEFGEVDFHDGQAQADAVEHALVLGGFVFVGGIVEDELDRLLLGEGEEVVEPARSGCDFASYWTFAELFAEPNEWGRDEVGKCVEFVFERDIPELEEASAAEKGCLACFDDFQVALDELGEDGAGGDGESIGRN
jgi:hypothetical protein